MSKGICIGGEISCKVTGRRVPAKCKARQVSTSDNQPNTRFFSPLQSQMFHHAETFKSSFNNNIIVQSHIIQMNSSQDCSSI